MGNLTIRTANEPDEIASGESAGSSSVLHFDHYTQLFIGGIPDNAVCVFCYLFFLYFDWKVTHLDVSFEWFASYGFWVGLIKQ